MVSVPVGDIVPQVEEERKGSAGHHYGGDHEEVLQEDHEEVHQEVQEEVHQEVQEEDHEKDHEQLQGIARRRDGQDIVYVFMRS